MITEQEVREWYKLYLKSLTEHLKNGGDLADEEPVMRLIKAGRILGFISDSDRSCETCGSYDIKNTQYHCPYNNNYYCVSHNFISWAPKGKGD